MSLCLGRLFTEVKKLITLHSSLFCFSWPMVITGCNILLWANKLDFGSYLIYAPMLTYPERLEVYLCFHILCGQEAKALARLHICAGSYVQSGWCDKYQNLVCWPILHFSSQHLSIFSYIICFRQQVFSSIKSFRRFSWQTVQTLMKCCIMQYFILVFTVGQSTCLPVSRMGERVLNILLAVL